MPGVDIAEFNARLQRECSESLIRTVGALRVAAEQAGPVAWRAHSTPGAGWGITGRHADRVIYVLDPKLKANHVQVFILKASVEQLSPLGTVANRPDQRWVAISRLSDGGRVLVEELLLQAHTAAAGHIDRRRTTSHPSANLLPASFSKPSADAIQ